MIEVPPPSSFEGQCLRYGAMSEWQYVRFRMKWAFVASAFAMAVAIWEVSFGTWFGYLLAGILLLSTASNLSIAFRWRTSWQFWNMSLELFFFHKELEAMNRGLESGLR